LLLNPATCSRLTSSNVRVSVSFLLLILGARPGFPHRFFGVYITILKFYILGFHSTWQCDSYHAHVTVISKLVPESIMPTSHWICNNMSRAQILIRTPTFNSPPSPSQRVQCHQSPHPPILRPRPRSAQNNLIWMVSCSAQMLRIVSRLSVVTHISEAPTTR
jgi:hypothetical protein